VVRTFLSVPQSHHMGGSGGSHVSGVLFPIVKPIKLMSLISFAQHRYRCEEPDFSVLPESVVRAKITGNHGNLLWPVRVPRRCHRLNPPKQVLRTHAKKSFLDSRNSLPYHHTKTIRKTFHPFASMAPTATRPRTLNSVRTTARYWPRACPSSSCVSTDCSTRTTLFDSGEEPAIGVYPA
jgi:hypothetical protein